MPDFRVTLRDAMTFIVKGNKTGRAAERFGAVIFIEDESCHDVFQARTAEIRAAAQMDRVTEYPPDSAEDGHQGTT